MINLNRRSFVKSLALGSAAGSLTTFSPLVLSAQHHRWAPYKSSIVIDGLSGAFGAKEETLSEDRLEKMIQSGITAVNATIPYPSDDFVAAKLKVEHAHRLITKYPKYLRLIKTPMDILLAKKNQQLGIIIGFQSTEMFDNKLDRIDYFAQQGARYMQLSYNGPSQFGSGGLVQSDTGLSKLGIDALKRIESNKVLLDSHSGKQTVAQAIDHSTRPLTISHTGCNAIYNHPRNNDDTELKNVALKGGVIGIYLMPFLEGGDGELTAAMLLKHIKHAVNLCGEDHVSIGSDQGVLPVKDGPEYREALKKEVEARIAAGISAPGETPNRPPFIPELNAVNRMELIAWHLSKSGFKDRVIEKILGNNLFDLYQRVW